MRQKFPSSSSSKLTDTTPEKGGHRGRHLLDISVMEQRREKVSHKESEHNKAVTAKDRMKEQSISVCGQEVLIVETRRHKNKPYSSTSPMLKSI